MLTRKYYELLADTLANHAPFLINNGINKDMPKGIEFDAMVTDFCILFKQDNKMFNRQKFEDRVYKQIGYPSTR
tara:strand:+ start:310 stop:531 length:222 start_codon:yes stop_codon:yes gene_type:complete